MPDSRSVSGCTRSLADVAIPPCFLYGMCFCSDRACAFLRFAPSGLDAPLREPHARPTVTFLHVPFPQVLLLRPCARLPSLRSVRTGRSAAGATRTADGDIPPCTISTSCFRSGRVPPFASLRQGWTLRCGSHTHGRRRDSPILLEPTIFHAAAVIFGCETFSVSRRRCSFQRPAKKWPVGVGRSWT